MTVNDPLLNHPNVKAAVSAEENSGHELPDSGEVDASATLVRDRIIHTLLIYPKLSLTMIQMGIGTSIAPALWKPILAAMQDEGIIKLTNCNYSTPSGRWQAYRVYSLAPEVAEINKKKYDML